MNYCIIYAMEASWDSSQDKTLCKFTGLTNDRSKDPRAGVSSDSLGHRECLEQVSYYVAQPAYSSHHVPPRDDESLTGRRIPIFPLVLLFPYKKIKNIKNTVVTTLTDNKQSL